MRAPAKPMAPVPLAQAGAPFPRLLPVPPPLRRGAGAVRASPTSNSTRSGRAGKLPARLQPNARRPRWHGGGFSLGVDLGSERTGLAVGRGITVPRPLTRRGLRVYLQDEHGTSIEALNYMISRGVKRSSRDVKSDAHAAVMILERYFSSSGQGAKIVLSRQQELQDRLIAQSRQDADI